ncbi:MFS transporter [Streptomyces hoynatensis]|uniref:MFS transporter n=1 Tax=Streptomyces hoynatensis TaxID=1141874 RepID=A0A3A9ZGS0_9ACTN|nr:MFS transporter [Streptomyces hoynatensis]RKN46904.1 MFS transporter [Streptomyces hoynatensis]
MPLRTSAYWHWSAGVQAGRLPAAMAPLAFTTLTVATTGSYRLGAVLMSVFVVVQTLGAVPAGRLLDRVGPGRGVPVLATCAAVAFGCLAGAAAAGAPAPVLLVLVAVPGAVAGGLPGGFRGLLARLVDDAGLPRAVSVDAMLVDAVLITGPVLVAFLAAAGTFLPILAMAGSFLVCGLLMAALPGRHVRPATGPGHSRPRLPLRAAAPWLGCQFAVGHVLSTVEVSPLAYAQRLGAGEAGAALIIATLCGSSIVGGALFAWRGRPAAGCAAAFLGCFLAGSLVLTAQGRWAGLVAAVVLIGGCTGPLLTVASLQIQRLLPPGRRAEGFSVSFVVQGTGFGLGSLAIGALSLPVAALLAATTAALACAGVLRRTRRGAPPLPEPAGPEIASTP